MTNTQLVITVTLPTLAVLIGILLNMRQVEGLERSMDKQMSSLRNELKADIEGLRISVESRLKAVEYRLDKIEDRLDQRLVH